MLLKENRLTKEKDFKQVFQKGKSFFSKEIGIRCAPNNLKVSRFGIVVSLKISKKATKRNKLKRQLRETIRLKLKGEEVNPGYDCIILTKPGILDKSYKELDEMVVQGLKKLKILK